MIGKRLKTLREELGLLQKDLASMLKISQQTISLYESDKREPDYEMLKKIAHFFGTTTDYLLGVSDIRNPYKPETIAAHHDGEEFTEEELEDIEKFKEFVKMRRQQKNI